MLPGTRAPVKVWTDPSTIESEAAQQLRNIGTLPWVEGVAVMPDVHYGKGATVGSVIAMRQALAPAAVGVDIGCGMSAVRTSLTADDLPDDLGRFGRRSRRACRSDSTPMTRPSTSHRVHGLPTAGWDRFWSALRRVARRRVEPRGARDTADGHARRWQPLHRGLPGAGWRAAGRVWLMLHSGSRNIGKELAERHIGVARKLPHNRICRIVTWLSLSPARRRWMPTAAI